MGWAPRIPAASQDRHGSCLRRMEVQKTINRKDYYGGALMVLIGLGAIYGGSDYHIGTLSHMGPGFFPPRWVACSH